MEYFFYPPDEKAFKESAVNNYVHTIVFDATKCEIASSFTRHVRKIWRQTCKNNIETDARIKILVGDEYQIYSWISKSKNNFNLPSFSIG